MEKRNGTPNDLFPLHPLHLQPAARALDVPKPLSPPTSIRRARVSEHLAIPQASKQRGFTFPRRLLPVRRFSTPRDLTEIAAGNTPHRRSCTTCAHEHTHSIQLPNDRGQTILLSNAGARVQCSQPPLTNCTAGEQRKGRTKCGL